MGLILTVTAGLIVWIVLWALGAKGFDAFLLADRDHPRRGFAEDPLGLPPRPSQLAPRARALAGPRRSRRRRSRAVGCARGSTAPDRRSDRRRSSRCTRACRCRGPGSRSPNRSSTARSSPSPRPAGAPGRSRSPTSRSTTPTPRRAVEPRHHRQQRQDAPPRTRARSPTWATTNSAATAISLPLINAAGILQVSPASPYVGLTSLARRGAGRARTLLPQRPAHLRAACSPGDPAQAAGPGRADALAGRPQRVRARRPGPVRRCRSPTIVAGDAAQPPGSTCAAHDSISTAPGAASRASRKDRRQRRRRRSSWPARAAPAASRCGGNCTSADPHLLLLGRARWRASPLRRAARPPRASHLPDHAAAAERLYPPPGAERARRLPARVRRRSRPVGALRLRGDAHGAGRDPLAPGTTPTTAAAVIARLLGAPRPRIRARPALDRSRRRNHALPLRRGQGQHGGRSRGLRPRDRHGSALTPRGSARRSAAGPVQAEDELEALDAAAELVRRRRSPSSGRAGRAAASRACGVSVRPRPSSRPSSVGTSTIRLGLDAFAERVARRPRVAGRPACWTGLSAVDHRGFAEAQHELGVPVESRPAAITSGSGKPARRAPTGGFGARDRGRLIGRPAVPSCAASLPTAAFELAASRIDHDRALQFEQPRAGGEHARRPHPAREVGARLGRVGAEDLERRQQCLRQPAEATRRCPERRPRGACPASEPRSVPRCRGSRRGGRGCRRRSRATIRPGSAPSACAPSGLGPRAGRPACPRARTARRCRPSSERARRRRARCPPGAARRVSGAQRVRAAAPAAPAADAAAGLM